MNHQNKMIFIVRHGERADNAGPEEQKKIEIPFDPHLTELGKIQAQMAGEFIKTCVKESFKNNLLNTEKVKYMIASSPFLRCLQTSYHLSLAFDKEEIEGDRIYADNSICELLLTNYFKSDPLSELYMRTKEESFKQHVPYTVQDGFIEAGKHIDTPTYPETIQKLLYRYELYDSLVNHYMKENNQEGNVVLIVVTHGYGVQSILEGLDSFDMFKGVEYTSVTQVVYNYESSGVSKVISGQNHDHLTKADEIYAVSIGKQNN